MFRELRRVGTKTMCGVRSWMGLKSKVSVTVSLVLKKFCGALSGLTRVVKLGLQFVLLHHVRNSPAVTLVWARERASS